MKVLNVNSPIISFLLLPLSALILFPFYNAGFFFDDIHNSVARGAMIYSNKSVYEVLASHWDTWIATNGRFFPVAILSGSVVWPNLDTLTSARMYQMLFALMNISVFFLLVKTLAKSAPFALLATGLLALTLQFNPRWDGLASFAALNQLVMLFTLVGIFYASKELYGRRSGLRVIHMVRIGLFCLAAMMTYEVGVVCPIIIVALGFLRLKADQSAARAVILAAASALVLYLAIYFYFYSNRSFSYEGSSIGNLSLIFTTLVAQAASSLPLGFVKNSVYGAGKFSWSGLSLGAVCFFILFYVFALKALIARSADIESSRRANALSNWNLVVVGTGLLLVPALIVGVSHRYQEIVTFGDPHISAYLQSFGAALLLALGLKHSLQKSKILGQTLFFLAALLSAYTVAQNDARIERKNQDFKYPRLVSEAFISKELDTLAPKDIKLLVNSPYPWESASTGGESLCSSFFSHWLTRKVECVGLETLFDAKGAPPLSQSFLIFQHKLVEGGARTLELHSAEKTVRWTIGENFAYPSREELVDFKPVFSRFTGGLYGWEPDPARRAWAWTNVGHSAIRFFMPYGCKLQVDMTLESAAELKLDINFVNDFRSLRLTSGQSIEFTFRSDLITMPFIDMKFLASGTPMKVAGDTREFGFRLIKFHPFCSK